MTNETVQLERIGNLLEKYLICFGKARAAFYVLPALENYYVFTRYMNAVTMALKRANFRPVYSWSYDGSRGCYNLIMIVQLPAARRGGRDRGAARGREGVAAGEHPRASPALHDRDALQGDGEEAAAGGGPRRPRAGRGGAGGDRARQGRTGVFGCAEGDAGGAGFGGGAGKGRVAGGGQGRGEQPDRADGAAGRADGPGAGG